MSAVGSAEEAAVRDLVARYTDAVNRRDAKAWAATWADDAEWSLGGSPVQGREAIVALWQRLMDGLPFVVQLVHSGVVQVDGERATARWYLSELHQSADRKGTLVVGVYHDECARTDEGWRFARRRFDALYAGPPDLSGNAPGFPEL
jgi:uncharacterized protein (TIGR02246 family)